MNLADEQLKCYLDYLEERGQVLAFYGEKSTDSEAAHVAEEDNPVQLAQESNVEENPSAMAAEVSPNPQFAAFVGEEPKVALWIPCPDQSVAKMATEEKMLLSKILKAIGLSFQQIAILPMHSLRDAEVKDSAKAIFVDHEIGQAIVFGRAPELPDVVSLCPHTRVVRSLGDMLADNAAKIESWQILKNL